MQSSDRVPGAGHPKQRRHHATRLLIGTIAAVGSAAHADTFTVTTTNDSGGGSLRDAITQANATTGLDEIVFQSGLNGVIALGSDLPTITDPLIITGPGPRNLTISGGNARRILNSAASLELFGLRLANGFTDRGGGLQFNGELLRVSDCHFDQNTVTNEGGAICVLAGSFAVQRVTFTTDQAAGSGGCIWWGQGGGTPTGTITNCTFVNNFASTAGGALRQFNATDYASSVTNCTFVVNNAGSFGGAIGVAGGTMTIYNSLFTANAAGGNPGGHIGTTVGTTTSLGHNLFGNLNGSNVTPDPTDLFGVVGNELNTGVLIAFPFNNGGLTDTTPLLATSIAIDRGGTTNVPAGDQRDFPRVGCAPDVGAFEVQTVTDTDGDGVLNCLDACPSTPACASVDQTGCPTDVDADGVFDGCDSCPNTLAGDPVNVGGCSTADEDGDGVLNDADRCRGTPACAIANVDVNGCPLDADTDGIFDGCDNCPGADDLTDTDNDGIPDCLDDCPNVGDTDNDGVQNCLDGCPNDPLKTSPGACGCGAADSDTDADGIANCVDACPSVGDTDGDGVDDCLDGCPNDAQKTEPGACGCGNVDVDSDGDGKFDCNDQCANTPLCASVDLNGCPTDGDADGVADGCDQCPNTLAGDTVDADGCSTADEDGDGVLNDADACRGTPACAIAGVNAAGCPADADHDGIFDGCDRCPGASDLTDTDGDGIPDCLDRCPNDGDSDGDGVQDCLDGCPADPLKTTPGVCGCGVADSDANGDSVPDCVKLPPSQEGEGEPPAAEEDGLWSTWNYPAKTMCGTGAGTALMMVSALLLVGSQRRR